jgi:hypothetical protein
MSPMMSQINLAHYDPMDRDVQQCPFAHYAAVRDHGPVLHHQPSGMYFVARHDVVNRGTTRCHDVLIGWFKPEDPVPSADVADQVGCDPRQKDGHAQTRC